MKSIFLILLTFFSTLAFGQFAIVLDRDGQCNVRSSPEVANNTSDTLKNGHFVYCFETKGNWTNIDYSKMSQALTGYVYHNRLKLVSDYQRIPLLTRATNSATYRKDSIEILVVTQKLDKGKYRFSYFKGNKDQIELVNGRPYWGTDGGLPKAEYKLISIRLGKKKVDLPKSALENLFEPGLNNTQVNYDQQSDILYIQSMNSDGAGGYEVIWKIEKGKYKNRYIADGF